MYWCLDMTRHSLSSKYSPFCFNIYYILKWFYLFTFRDANDHASSFVLKI